MVHRECYIFIINYYLSIKRFNPKQYLDIPIPIDAVIIPRLKFNQHMPNAGLNGPK